MERVKVLCLANSRKIGGRCVAGLRMDGGGWIRPVSGLPDGTLKPSDYALEGGREPRPLDVIEILVDQHKPKPHQPENWSFAPKPWQWVQKMDPGEAGSVIHGVLVRGPELFGNQKDRVPISSLERNPARSSLAIIQPSEIRWVIGKNVKGRRQTRVGFNLSGCSYSLAVTDPLWEKRLESLTEGTHPRNAAGIADEASVLLTVSLGEPMSDGMCYKLVAAVIA